MRDNLDTEAQRWEMDMVRWEAAMNRWTQDHAIDTADPGACGVCAALIVTAALLGGAMLLLIAWVYAAGLSQ